METCDPWILAKLAIFATDILWESCSKFYFKHICHNKFNQNIVSLIIIMNINFKVNFLKKLISKIFFQKYILVQNFVTNTMIYVITDGHFFYLHWVQGCRDLLLAACSRVNSLQNGRYIWIQHLLKVMCVA